MSDPTQTQAVEALADLFAGHSRDTMAQDSGQHCKCGSDSRFKRNDGTGPWRTMDEHRAQLVLTSDWLAARDAAQRRAGAEGADLFAAAMMSERADRAEADLARLREAVLTWADDQMQALPEYRTPVAHGKAELLAELRSVLAQSGERA